jgi:hypothetical protein
VAKPSSSPVGAAQPHELQQEVRSRRGRVGAVDKSRTGRRLVDPVTTFRRSNTIYATAMRWNSDLDRDKDKIACEKR